MAGTVQDAVDVGSQVHHLATRLEIFATVRVKYRTTAGRQHDALPGGEVANHLSLAAPETFFTLDLENPWNRGAGTRLYFMVGIDELFVQLFGESAADRSLACAHQADEKNII